MKRRDGQLLALLAVLAIIVAAPLVARWVRREPPPPPADGRLDLNAATREELSALPGIGDTRAEAILRFRAMRGRLGSVDDLCEVPGLDAKTVERLRPFVKVE